MTEDFNVAGTRLIVSHESECGPFINERSGSQREAISKLIRSPQKIQEPLNLNATNFLSRVYILIFIRDRSDQPASTKV
jgi:hypothetical protein